MFHAEGIDARAAQKSSLLLILFLELFSKIGLKFEKLFFICWIPHAEGILARAAELALENSTKTKLNIQRRAGFSTT